MLAYYIRCFINVLQLILVCVPPLIQHALLSASAFYTFIQHIKVASWIKGVGKGETGLAKQKWFVTLKSSFTIYEKKDF